MVTIYDIVRDERDFYKLVPYKEYGEVIFEEEDDEVFFLADYENMRSLYNEKSYVAAYDLRGNLIGFYNDSIGTIDCVNINIPNIIIFLLLCGARGYRMFHNHPSESLSFSENDFLVTDNIKNITDVLKIELLDDIIIGKNAYRSLKKGKTYGYEEEN